MKHSSRIVLYSLILFALFACACGSEEQLPALEMPDESVPDIAISDPDFPHETAQKLQFVETTDPVFNPDQGFYRPIDFVVTSDGITFYDTPVTDFANAWEIRKWDNYIANRDKPWSDKDRFAYEYTSLYHLRFDISALSHVNNGAEDKPISESALKDLETVIKAFSDKELSIIVRFCYAPKFGDMADAEPSVEMMNSHIEAISGILTKYADTVTGIEMGLIGPWGEMHTSKLAEDGKTIPALMEKWLDATEGTEIPVLVRTPRHVYQYIYNYIQNHDAADYHLKLDAIGGAKIPEDHKAYRLSLFNDGYMASATDFGTYYDRPTEVAWAEHLTNHGPYGGEVTVDSGKGTYYYLTNTKEFNTLDEMYFLHLSYLDINYNGEMIKYWNETKYKGHIDTALFQNKTEYDFLQAHMGYRFVLRASTIAMSENYDRMKVSFSVQNKGFGNLYRTKYYSLIAVEQTTHEVQEYRNLFKYSSKTQVNLRTDISLKPGTYDIYLRIAGEDGRYAVRFANEGLWSEAYRANRVGSVVIPE